MTLYLLSSTLLDSASLSFIFKSKLSLTHAALFKCAFFSFFLLGEPTNVAQIATFKGSNNWDFHCAKCILVKITGLHFVQS